MRHQRLITGIPSLGPATRGLHRRTKLSLCTLNYGTVGADGEFHDAILYELLAILV